MTSSWGSLNGSSLKIWETTPVLDQVNVDPAKPVDKVKWDSWGLPIGNGRLGAVFYGHVKRELIQFNEDSLWTGFDTHDIVAREGSKRVDDRNYGSYQPFGDIILTVPHESISDYYRELDIERAVGLVSYTCNGVKYKREYFSSYPDQVIVVRLTADKPGSITGGIKLSDKHFGKIEIVDTTVTARGVLDEKFYVTKGSLFTKIAYGSPEEIAAAIPAFAGNNMKYESRLRVIADGGRVTVGEEGELKVENVNSVTLLLAAGTDYAMDYANGWRGADPSEKVSKQLEAASKLSYDDLLARHIEDYRRLYTRFSLNLGKSDSPRIAMPMSKRLEAYRADANDPELVSLITQFGRYLLISCSRPGSLPANLQGLWNPERFFASWSSDYTLNVNLQMSYWQTGPGGISECDEPLFDLLKAVIPVLEREVKTHEGPNVRGWAAGWHLNPFGNIQVQNWSRVEGAWVCMHLYEHYRFTHNRDMLEKVIYPIIQGAVYFWEDTLIEKNGVLLAPNVKSPEWGPTEDGVLYAQELIWELFTEYVEIADILGKDKAHRDKIAMMITKLAKPEIGKHGEVKEWQSDQPTLWGKQHRHSSHLVGLFPGRQIAPSITPELAKAAEVTLYARGDGAEAWSKIHKAAMWARLYKGKETMDLLETFIKTHILPNGFAAIHTNDKVVNDSNFGFPAVVFEMLLQSQTGEVNLLPALPDDFPSGKVQGIRARDGFVVDMEWSNGKLVRAVVQSTFGGPQCKVRYADKVVVLDITQGQRVVLDGNLKIVK